MGQIKNIKLHIVTDIKKINCNIDSASTAIVMTSDMPPQPTAIYRFTAKNDIETVTSEVGPITPDVQNIHNLKKFTKELQKFANKYKKQQPQRKKQKLEFAFIPTSAYISQELIFSALKKCMVNENFWSAKGFQMLLENKYIMAGYNDALVFECIIKYKSFSLPKFVAQTFQVVGDKYVVQVLAAILHNIAVDDSAEVAQKGRYYSDCPVSDIAIADMSYAMVLPVNKTSLRESLKVLTLDEALITLQCLVYMLHVVSPALARDATKSSKFDGRMTEGQIVMWIDLLLSAHLMGFASTHILESLISDINLCIQKQLNYHTQVAELASFLKHAKSGNIVEQPIGKYAVETITL